ncbi:MAG: DUF5667 domain-containing protein [Candidatus Roizmanbacteria bacterium]|nr:DUF5667 domain-containing protein [Candidatus Roizmanbacteria bacterium]
MKQLYPACFVIIIVVFLSYSSYFATSTVEAHSGAVGQIAKNTTADSENMMQDAVESTESASVEYTLAYPGMLPGHPLYKLKVARDKLQAYLISSPAKKVQFYLKQADKGMFATLLLSEQEKQDLTTETALKAEHNITLANTYLKQHTEKPNADLFATLRLASTKHKETLESARTHLDEEHQKVLDQVLQFVQVNLDYINRLESIPADRWNTDK